MPLSRRDLSIYKPSVVFLGHIHKSFGTGIVHYPGSPCAIDISETGYRHFLFWDSSSNEVSQQRVNVNSILISQELILVPNKDEKANALKALQETVNDWGIDTKDYKRIILRLKLKGYSSDRKMVFDSIKKASEEFNLYQDIDVCELYFSDDKERDYLVENFKEALDEKSLGRNA